MSRLRPHGMGRGWLLASLLLLLACGGEPDAAVAVVVDSAGVEIVSSAAPVWGETGGWHVGEILLSLGSEADPLFDVVGAARRPGGGIVVGLGSSGEIRFYDASGELEAAWGRSGGGPGEFRILQSVGLLAGDTAWAYDYALRRMTILEAQSGVLEVVPLQPAPARALVVGSLSARGWVLREAWGDGAGRVETGLRRDPVRIFRATRDGHVGEALASLPGREVLISSEGGRGVMGTAPFARNASVSVLGGRVVMGDQVGYELRIVDAGGRVEGIVRWGGPSLDVTAAEVDAWKEAQVAEADPRDRAGMRAYLEVTPMPDRRPAYGTVLPGPGGEIWVAAYAQPGASPAACTVLGPDGSWLGPVTMPAGFTPLQVERSWILGLQTDDLGAEQV
ncbi:MAG: hypothetical protein JSU98_15635, partial [Gemmatimonadales bacterium]